MSKKRKGNKPTSARGHEEGNVIRWREKVDLIRVDRKGRPIKSPIPVNTFDRNWLAQNLIDTGSHVLSSPPKPPDNVSKMSDHRPKPKPKPEVTAGNEAESLPPDKGKQDYAFLHNKSMAVDEFRHWSRLSKEIGRSSPVVWVKIDGKLSSPDLELQRQRSKDGHSKPKLKFKSPPSSVHNPMISASPIVVHNKRLRAAVHSKGLSPSGKPISTFTVGQIKTIENPVVYTTKWPFVKEVKATAVTPPTASRHWHGKAANDGDITHLHRTPDVKSIEHQLNSEVQWFINHVEPQNWPTHVHNFAHWKSGGPTPNTGAINKAAAEWGERYALMKAMYHGLHNDWKMLDSALAMSNQEVSLLRQELEAERQANSLMEYDIAMRNGEDPETVRDSYNIIKPKTPDVPDDADVMLAQFKVYQSFVKCDGPEHAFARYVYGDPRLGEVIRDQADMKAAHRAFLCDERGALHRIAMKVRERNVNAGYVKYPEIKRFREQAALVRIKHKVKAYNAKPPKIKDSLYYSRLRKRSVEYDTLLYSYWGNKVTPFNRKKPVNYQQVINDVVGVRSVAYSSPTNVLFYNELGIKHKKCMSTKNRKFYLSQTWKGDVIRTINKVAKFLNTEVNPRERKRMKEEAILRRNEKAENKKRREQRAAKEAAKRAFRMAH